MIPVVPDPVLSVANLRVSIGGAAVAGWAGTWRRQGGRGAGAPWQQRAGPAAGPISPSALRRPAPADDDRHGADVRSGVADRRRTDNGPRCDGAGADSAAVAEAAAGV